RSPWPGPSAGRCRRWPAGPGRRATARRPLRRARHSSERPPEQLGHVDGLGALARPPAPAGEVEEAARVAGRYVLGAGGGGLGQLVVGHRRRDLAVLGGERAAEAAALLGLGHLQNRGSRRLQERPGRGLQPQDPQTVAGVWTVTVVETSSGAACASRS